VAASPAAAAPAASPAVAAPAGSPAAKPAVDYKAEMATLYEAAKKEGKLVLYSSMNLDDAKVVLPEFEKTFPGVKVEHIRAQGEDLMQRIITETKGGKVLADVFDTNAAQVAQVVQEGILDSYAIPAAADLPASFKDPQNRWTTERVTTVILGFNSSQVKPEEAPKTWDDLADPKWKGKIIMEVGDQEMLITLLKQKYTNEEQGIEVFKKIAANQPQAFSGHTQQSELLAAGQGAVCMACYGHHIIALQQKGAPVDFTKTEGVLYSLVFGLVKSAPNPNAGKLYLNWTMSPDGQKVLGAAGRAPARSEVPISTPLMPQGMKWYVSRPDYMTDFTKYDKIWRDTFQIRG
jgi:iron(III) transport system substrate-binding protein